ncbi:MAG: response regulator [Steroidobacteraceae bacterium]|jgi:PAS domain S-box-containing protein|nr:response regulator [Steroidobacteraceae bacterium]
MSRGEKRRSAPSGVGGAHDLLDAHRRMEQKLLELNRALEQRTNELAYAAAMLRATLEATADAVLVTDAEARILEFNEKYLQLWGLDSAQVRSRRHGDVLRVIARSFADPAAFAARVEEICTSARPHSFDVLELADGRVIERFSTLQTVDGRDVGRVWSFRDVTEERRVQRQVHELNVSLEAKVAERTAALQRSDLQFQQLVAGVDDCAIYMLDPQGMVASWNPGAERIKGYRSEEIIGQHFSVFYTEADRQDGKPERTLAVALRDGKYEAETWRVRKDGTRFWASVLVEAIHAADGRLLGFAKITRDMTERRAIEEQLHQSQKMEAVGQLTGGVAHDFNNLLTVILGNLETIWRRLPEDDARLRRAVDQATRGAQRAATLTSQLLAFSRRQPLNPKPTDVNRLVSGVSELIRRTLNENIAIETVLGGGLWRAEIDPHQLESALLNLAVNARDAMPSGGRITIETANAYLDENYTAHYAEITPGQYVLICVTDTGCGMSPDVLEHAFDPFFTTKPLGEGTGLGLSQVFGFVKQSGGHIKLYSEDGHGTAVKIYLPRMVGEAAAHEPESPPPCAPGGDSSETILVVEDDDDVRSYSTESLRELGFTVLEAHDGATALKVLDRCPQVQLLFTDVGLPGVNGRQLADEAQRRKPGLKILFTSGYARNAIVHQGRLDPGVELLTKPFTRAQLASRIRDVLDQKRDFGDGPNCVLVVEDEPLVRMFLADVLESRGFTVVQSASARDASAAVERLRQPLAAFVDLGLPDRKGGDLAAELRTRWPDIRIIILSGHGDAPDGRFCSDRSVTFLKKPFDEAALIETLEKLGLAQAGKRTADSG